MPGRCIDRESCLVQRHAFMAFPSVQLLDHRAGTAWLSSVWTQGLAPC